MRTTEGKSCQQYEIYGAQAEAPEGRTFTSVEEMQSYVDSLRDTVWWQRHYSNVLRIEVYDRPTGKKDSVGSWVPLNAAGVIEIGNPRERTVLHEVAHVLAAARFGSKAHDPYFARIFLELVAHVMGSEAFVALHAAFDKHGIEHDPDIPAERYLGDPIAL